VGSAERGGCGGCCPALRLGELHDLVRGDGQIHDIGLEQRAEVMAVSLAGELGIVAKVGE
jgi:hypothetical protein